jgi:hypothetical protein
MGIKVESNNWPNANICVPLNQQERQVGKTLVKIISRSK